MVCVCNLYIEGLVDPCIIQGISIVHCFDCTFVYIYHSVHVMVICRVLSTGGQEGSFSPKHSSFSPNTFINGSILLHSSGNLARFSSKTPQILRFMLEGAHVHPLQLSYLCSQTDSFSPKFQILDRILICIYEINSHNLIYR